MNLRGLERLDKAVSLEVLLLRLHGKRDIDRQHQREIDLGFGQSRLAAPVSRSVV
jgi:hypothetical protein